MEIEVRSEESEISVKDMTEKPKEKIDYSSYETRIQDLKVG
jgi:hypothetical protein